MSEQRITRIIIATVPNQHDCQSIAARFKELPEKCKKVKFTLLFVNAVIFLTYSTERFTLH